MLMYGLMLMLFTACETVKQRTNVPPPSAPEPEKVEVQPRQVEKDQSKLWDAYRKAIIRMKKPDPSMISRNLTAIVPYNSDLKWKQEDGKRKVLMLLWTMDDFDKQTGKVIEAKEDLWVTAVPDVKEFFIKEREEGLSKDDIPIRLIQLLGLPPNCGYRHLVEIWVSPEDLFRPSRDPEITDHEAELAFRDNAFQKTTKEYREWFRKNLATSFKMDGFPWGQLGYTYDWGNENDHVGMSQFVIKKGSKIEIDSICNTMDYFK
jgi:hypothetical protein